MDDQTRITDIENDDTLAEEYEVGTGSPNSLPSGPLISIAYIPLDTGRTHQASACRMARGLLQQRRRPSSARRKELRQGVHYLL